MRNLTRYRTDPLNFFDDMRDSFQSFFDDFPALSFTRPAMDVKKEKDNYIIEAEVPGLKQDEINIEIGNDNVITISSEKEEEKEEKDKDGYVLKERRQESFRRSFRMPSDVDSEKIEADFKDGILTIELPRIAVAEPRRIQIGKTQTS